MKQVNVKKLLILNLPYLLFVWLLDKGSPGRCGSLPELTSPANF